MRLFYVESSPRKERSHSIKVAKAFLSAYKEAHPDHEIDILDLWKEEMPPFDGASINAKYTVMHGKNPTDAEKKAWDVIAKMADRLKGADKLVMSIPMWNFHVPYKLKHYIDLITQPGITFKGNEGLVPDKPVVVIYSSAGSYRSGSEAETLDHQKPYIRMWLKYIGLKNVKEIIDDSTVGSDKSIEEEAIKLAQKIAKTF